ncbi:endonuclease-reverse transcriptase [Trichonephila clavipes]|uniref:Endonuclease-reverse transcriptase n=1 Tax=Trichonephila clavipes TaxID=2585209 RepID=A0A8X6UWQ4_TRICX|nr:endonuclease-reverse transcriptase [Trichonephila clavipes]
MAASSSSFIPTPLAHTDNHGEGHSRGAPLQTGPRPKASPSVGASFRSRLCLNQMMIQTILKCSNIIIVHILRKPGNFKLHVTWQKWLYKEPQVTQVIRSNRLRWLGHIWRSHENNQTRAYTFKKPMGSRTRGRPPKRWIDVENDLKTLNIKNWQRVAAYRWNWRKRAVEAAKTCNRLLRL